MNLDCQNVREVMDSYLSEELSVESNHAFLRHAAECRECAAELKRRQRLRTLLAGALDVSVDADRARARITQAVDRERRPWQHVVRFGSLAATIIAAVAVAYWAGRRVDAVAYDDSAEDHIACALAYPEDTAYDANLAAQSLVPPFGPIVDAVGLSHGVYRVIDAHMCPYKGRNYAHLVIRGDGQTLSLFAESNERGTLPSTPTTVLAGDTLDVHATSRLGYRISAVAMRNHQVFLVSEQPTDPPELAQDILRSAVRFIRSLEK